MNTQKIRDLAKQVAEDHMSALEFLSIVEAAEERDLGLSDDELRDAHILALKAKILISEDMPPSKQALLDTAEKVTTGVIHVIRSSGPTDDELEKTWPLGKPRP